MQKIKKGDTVEMIAGKDRGQRGMVHAVLPKEDRIVVERVNIVKKHQKQQQAGNQQIRAGIIEFEAPVSISNVMLVCKHCDKKTRVGIRINEENKRVRFCKHCNQDVD